MIETAVTKHDIVYQLYPDATGCRSNKDGTLTAFKGQDVLSIDQSAVDAEFTKQKYKNERKIEYPALSEQFDLLYKDIIAGKVDATGEFAKAIKANKDKYPKP